MEEQLGVPGIFAPNPISITFSNCYSEQTNLESKCVKQLDHFELQSLVELSQPVGRFRKANLDDLQNLVRFSELSQSEENTQRPYDSQAAKLEGIHSESLYVWENSNGQIVSMGNYSTNGSSRSGYISGIYTEKGSRRRGIGSAVTARLAKIILDQELIPSLSVDVLNEPAASIYKNLGFAPRCRMDNIRFSARNC